MDLFAFNHGDPTLLSGGAQDPSSYVSGVNTRVTKGIERRVQLGHAVESVSIWRYKPRSFAYGSEPVYPAIFGLKKTDRTAISHPSPCDEGERRGGHPPENPLSPIPDLYKIAGLKQPGADRPIPAQVSHLARCYERQ
jgi:hypothetical protein